MINTPPLHTNKPLRHINTLEKGVKARAVGLAIFCQQNQTPTMGMITTLGYRSS